MTLIKELFNRKQIEKEVIEIVTKQTEGFNSDRLFKLTDKKAQKKTQQAILKLKQSLKTYISENKLSLYGKSRVLKITQDQLFAMNLDSELVKSIVKSIMLG